MFFVHRHNVQTTQNVSGHILDLHCVWLLNAAPFWGEIFLCPFFQKVLFFNKKASFLANIKHCPKFLEYALCIQMLMACLLITNRFIYKYIQIDK